MITLDTLTDTLQKRYPSLSFFVEEFKEGYLIIDLKSGNILMYACVGASTPKGFLTLYDVEGLSESFLDEDFSNVSGSAIDIVKGSLRHIPLVGRCDFSFEEEIPPHKDASKVSNFFNNALKYRYPKYMITQIRVYKDGVIAVSETPNGLLSFKENSLEPVPKSYEVVFQHGENNYEMLGVLPYNTKFLSESKTPELKLVT